MAILHDARPTVVVLLGRRRRRQILGVRDRLARVLIRGLTDCVVIVRRVRDRFRYGHGTRGGRRRGR